MVEELQTLYRTAPDGVRSRFEGSESKAAQYFGRYIEFVNQSVGPREGRSLLDIGCGAGWSTYFFARSGYRATGIDLNAAAFEPPSTTHLTLLEGSALALEFDDGSFDVVTAYQTLEHIPDPRAALCEMLRVCKPGGTLCVAGPNLISIGNSLKAVLANCRNRPLTRAFLREADTPRHPFGNTLFESLAILPLNLGRVLWKSLSPDVCFTMRQPDLTPPFHADNDASYLCNPLDFIRFFARHGCELVQNGAYGRLPFTAMIAGGTWVAVRRPLMDTQ
jgi:SAM-dependent methyltransferase